MLRILSLLLMIIAGSCRMPDKSLEEKVQTLELHYIAWACPCANWATLEDIKKYNDKGDMLADRSVYVEAADPSVKMPDTLGVNLDIIRFTGQFYKEKGYPKDADLDPRGDRARVFRYMSYKVISSNYRELTKLEP